ncbi:MAG: thiamine phosphate synthase [Candidatus Aureabacteria bacterium]|nr:thiamine phosphate synthase [Candidatus Auribacterota bacterium]
MSPAMNIGLYVILDKKILARKSIESVIGQLLDAGVTWFQYRDKSSSDEEYSRALATIIPLCRGAGAKLILNDRVELVRATGADGIHIGQGDMPVPEARRIVGPEEVIGVTVRSVDDALSAESSGADYLAVGAVYATETKPEAPVIGLEGLSAVCRCARVPVVAIGGIDENNVRDVVRAGASGVAVASAILRARDIGGTARKIMRLIKECPTV